MQSPGKTVFDWDAGAEEEGIFVDEGVL